MSYQIKLFISILATYIKISFQPKLVKLEKNA